MILEKYDGRYIPVIPNVLGEIQFARVNSSVAILIWFMIYLIGKYGENWLKDVFLERIDIFPTAGLLPTLILLFSFQGDKIINNPLHIL